MVEINTRTITTTTTNTPRTITMVEINPRTIGALAQYEYEGTAKKLIQGQLERETFFRNQIVNVKKMFGM